MSQTLHIALKPLDPATAELRYYFDNPNDYQARPLPLAAIQKLIDRAETDYYTLLPADLAQTGQQLYAWLDSADRFLAQAIEAIRRQTEILVLAIAASGRLAHLPWETLHDGVGFLVQRQNPFIVPVRWQEQKAPLLPPENRALRVLFMATSPLGVEPVLDYENEEGLILEATRKQPLTLMVEESGDLAELKNLIDSYDAGYFDVVHLTGHATLADQEPVFLTETETGGAHYAPAAEIGRALTRLPRLIFLSGCRTGEAPRAGSVPSLAEALLGQGARAVLGWGRPVLDPEASAAAATLYAGLATGAEPARALAETYQALLEQQARDWHLLRLYLAGDPPGPLVTPLKTRGRLPAPPPSTETKFLDPRRQQVKVPTRQSFVGRRRALQRCLQALRYAPDKIGVLLYGMGGLGKSSLAARLADRLPDYQTLVWVGPLDEFALANRLAEEAPLNQAQRETLLNPQEELRFKLRTVLGQVDPPLLLVLDDFEANFEHNDGQLMLRAGLPLLSTEAKKVLAALAFAIQQGQGRHRLLVTSRYRLDVAEAAALFQEPLDPLRGADLAKKVRRLERAKQPGAILKELEAQAISVADGNPRLLEWLFEILGQAGLDHAQILERMAAKAVEFRESILAEELLRQQEAALRQMLAAALVYQVPVPYPALAALCEDRADLETHLRRAEALGLVEVTRQPTETDLYYAPRLLAEPLAGEAPPDPAALARLATETLYRLWWQEADRASEEQLLEIHRLALAGQVGEIAAEIATHLARRWVNRSRYREAADLSRQTLALAADYRVLHQLARAEDTLGQVESAVQHYRQAMQGCPEDSAGEKAAMLHNLASIYANQGQIEEALRLYRQSLDMKESIGDVQGKAATLAMMAQLLAYRQGDFETALAYLQESAAILERLKSPDAETVKRIMAQVYTQQVRQQLGEEKFQQLQAALAAGDEAQVKALLGESAGR
ncbi:MAG: tetratricopeptide repeat protein [Anaerolineales bacterium]|nr:tetratricopeptide repeat protein [Anaerolineales bacterium]